MKARGCADEEDCGAGGSAGSSDDIHVFLQRAVCLFRGKDQGCSVRRDGAGICRSRHGARGSSEPLPCYHPRTNTFAHALTCTNTGANPGAL